MAKSEDIEMLTVEEFMDGLDYAVKKKKRKLINELKKEANKQYPHIDDQVQKEEKVKTITEQAVTYKNIDEVKVDDTKRTQAIKELYYDDLESDSKPKAKKKLNIFLLISFILGVLYSIYVIYHCVSTYGASSNDFQSLGIELAITIAIPHIICTLLATLFNGLGLFLNKKGFALTGAILYTIACVLMPAWFMFTVVQAILSYVGFSRITNKVYIPRDEF
ncbi:hypothetical protein [Candidatus Stoquefichus sp. SB1]|uniref:hypothetical protein n=1 Tax=Candidatus Stoquefichus sp. SB1 TaxID=1658109 RepID=UPI00067F6904|nr:hypothetical protein [Candidatus Stoquefichus sp. SB1]